MMLWMSFLAVPGGFPVFQVNFNGTIKTIHIRKDVPKVAPYFVMSAEG